MNLSGALDNMAWVLGHELAPFEEVLDERNFKHQRWCSLRQSSKLMDAVEGLAPAFASTVAAKQDWMKELKSFRDPVAHRLPVQLPPAVLLDDQREEWESIETEIKLATESGNLHRALELSMRQQALGTFLPLAVVAGQHGTRLAGIGTMGRDHLNFLELLKALLVDLANICH